MTCKVEKIETEFRHDKNREDGLQPVCKSCQMLWYKDDYAINKGKIQKQNKNRRLMWKEFIDSLKTKCKYCQETTSEVLDFHHLNIDEKEFSISKMVNRMYNEVNRNLLLEEVKKCTVACANCHRKIHLGIINV